MNKVEVVIPLSTLSGLEFVASYFRDSTICEALEFHLEPGDFGMNWFEWEIHQN